MWVVFKPSTKKALAELEGAPDRVVGVVAGAIIDSSLTDILREELKPNASPFTKEIQDLIFQPDGPLGNFCAKTWIAYLLGFFTQQAMDDLRQFAKIRNRFAHYSEYNSFDTNEISSRCLNFQLIERHIRPPAAWVAYESGATKDIESFSSGPHGIQLNVVNYEDATKTPKGRFISTTKLFVAAFELYTTDEPPHLAKHKPLL